MSTSSYMYVDGAAGATEENSSSGPETSRVRAGARRDGLHEHAPRVRGYY